MLSWGDGRAMLGEPRVRLRLLELGPNPTGVHRAGRNHVAKLELHHKHQVSLQQPDGAVVGELSVDLAGKSPRAGLWALQPGQFDLVHYR